MSEGTTRLVAYYRYSGGGNQTEQSIEGQRRDCEAWAASHGLSICAEYIDRHISGTTDDRPDFQRMIADSDRHAFDAVICWKTDRISRNRYDSAIYKTRLRKNGVKIIYAAESIPDGPDGIILESLMEGLAEYYSAELSQKLRRGMRESAMKCHGLGGYYALGLTTNKQHEFIIDETQAPTVRWIFEQYAAGKQAAAIVRELNGRGVKTAYGKDFSRSSILRIVTNEQYIGVYNSHGYRKEGGIPAIIDRDLWDAAQHQVEINKDRKAPLSRKADYLLSGKLFCAECKTAMRGTCGTSHTGQTHYYYTCPGRRKKLCSKKNIVKDDLENLVCQATSEYILQPGRLEAIADRLIEVQIADQKRAHPEREMLETELAENRRKQDNLLRALEDGISTAGVMQRLQDLEKAEAKIRYDLDRIQPVTGQFTKEQLEFMLSQFAAVPSEQPADYQARLIRTFVSSVYLSDTHALIYYNLTNKKSELESSLVPLTQYFNPENDPHNSGVLQGSSHAAVGGGDGSRTHVRKEISMSISGCRRSTTFPPCHADRQASTSVAS